MGSFWESRRGGPLWPQDALWLEHELHLEEKEVFIFNQICLKRSCVFKQNNLNKMNTNKCFLWKELVANNEKNIFLFPKYSVKLSTIIFLFQFPFESKSKLQPSYRAFTCRPAQPFQPTAQLSSNKHCTTSLSTSCPPGTVLKKFLRLFLSGDNRFQ